jgi:hypothetical protein
VNGQLDAIINDAHTFKDKHGEKATRIKSERMLRDSSRVFGTLFDVEGDVASPFVFYLTDSTDNFLYGALYFDSRPNADSLGPVTDRIRASGANPTLSISGLLLTMFDSRTNLNPAVEKEVRSHFQDVVYKSVIPRTVRFAEAPSHGKTIFEHDPHGSGTLAYRKLAKEFLDRQKQGMAFVNKTGQ